VKYTPFFGDFGSRFYEKFNILVSKGVDRVEAPVVALVTNLVAEGAAAGSAGAARRGRGCRLSLPDHLADLHVRVRFRVVAKEIHQFRGPCRLGGFVDGRLEEDAGGRARWWLRCLRRGHPGFPLCRWRVGAEPWRGREVLRPAWRVGWRDRCVDGSLAGRPCVPEAVLEKVPFAFQEGHLVVEHGDVPPEQVDLPVGLAWCPFGRGEFVAAERTLLFPKLLEAGLASHVAAFHDRGIGVGKRFQADATLRRLAVEGLQHQPAHVRVNRGHLVVRAPKGDFLILNIF
jgi:hypothetical protein